MMKNGYENETLHQIHERKSVRVYDAAKPVNSEMKEQILQAAIAAPTAGCMCLYTILDITDCKIKKQLSILCDNQPFIATAPVVLVFLADWQRWYDSFLAACGEKVRTPKEGDLMLATADAVIAAHNVVVAAEAMGLGSCYIGDVLENGEDVAELLSIPRYAMPVAMLCIGFPTTQQKARVKPRRFDADFLVHENGYQRQDLNSLQAMVDRREQKEGAFVGTVQAIEKRKWSCDFTEEMNRSVRYWLKRWTGDQ